MCAAPPYPDEPFECVLPLINEDLWRYEGPVLYATKGGKRDRIISEVDVEEYLSKGFEVFGTFDAWKAFGYGVAKGQKCRGHRDAQKGCYFTQEQVDLLIRLPWQGALDVGGNRASKSLHTRATFGGGGLPDEEDADPEVGCFYEWPQEF